LDLVFGSIGHGFLVSLICLRAQVSEFDLDDPNEQLRADGYEHA
jgi:hypothetical protein